MIRSKLPLSISWAVVGAILLCLFSYGVGIIYIPDKHWALDRNIDLLIRTELPNGAKRSQVETWLVAKGVTVFGYESGEELQWDSMVLRSKHKPSQLSGVIIARLDTGHSLANHMITYIVFFFDKQSKLIDRSTERGGVGL